MTKYPPCIRYTSPLFYIAPIYHLAFINLQRILVIDSTDLAFNCDVKVDTFLPQLH